MGHLIDATTGTHLWADSFEGGLEDIFALQDQVTASVVGAIAPELEKAEIDRARRKPTASLDAYDYFLRGMAEVHKWKREANAEALRLFGKAIELDPDFAAAWGMAARCLSQRKASGWVTDHAPTSPRSGGSPGGRRSSAPTTRWRSPPPGSAWPMSPAISATVARCSSGRSRSTPTWR